MSRLGGLAATTAALTVVLILIFGVLLLSRPIIRLIDRFEAATSPNTVNLPPDTSEEGRRRRIELLWDFYREVQVLVRASDHDRDVANNALQAISSGEATSPSLYLLLKEAERNQNRAAARVRELAALPEIRQARSDLYTGLRQRAEAAGHFAAYLNDHNLEDLWLGKLAQERGDGLIAGALDAIRAYGYTIGIDLTTGRVDR